MDLLNLPCTDAYAMGEGDAGLGQGAALRVRSRNLLDNVEALVRAEASPPEPIPFVADEGNDAQDVIGTTYGVLLLVSDRVVRVLHEHRFSGWATFLVQIELQGGARLEGYHGIAVTGRAGPIDDNLSERIVLPAPVPGGREAPGLRGLCFPPESWDGSDLFTAERSLGLFVVEDVKVALEEAGITNIDFRRLSDIERTWRANGDLVAPE